MRSKRGAGWGSLNKVGRRDMKIQIGFGFGKMLKMFETFLNFCIIFMVHFAWLSCHTQLDGSKA